MMALQLVEQPLFNHDHDREETNMAEARRSYRAAQPPAAPVEREEIPFTAPPQGQAAAKKPFTKSVSHNITGLFEAKSGKAHTVRVTEAICGELKAIQPGDVLGISQNSPSGRWGLFFFEGND